MSQGGYASQLLLTPVAQECNSLFHICQCWVNDDPLSWKTTWSTCPRTAGLTRSRASCCLQLLTGCHIFMEECIPVHTPTLPYYYCPVTTQLDTKPCCVHSNTLKSCLVMHITVHCWASESIFVLGNCIGVGISVNPSCGTEPRTHGASHLNMITVNQDLNVVIISILTTH